MDFRGGVRAVLPISCSILCLRGASGLTWPALRMGSALFLGVVCIKMTAFWELAAWVTWEVRAGVRPWSAGSQMEEVNSDTVRPELQNSRFFSLALDVKFISHSFLLAPSFWSVLHFITTAAAGTQIWILWWCDESAKGSQYLQNVSCCSFYFYFS